jgi:hypothetical protein
MPIARHFNFMTLRSTTREPASANYFEVLHRGTVRLCRKAAS